MWHQAKRYVGHAQDGEGAGQRDLLRIFGERPPTFLNIGKNYPNLRASRSSSGAKTAPTFSTRPEVRYRGKTVLATGKIRCTGAARRCSSGVRASCSSCGSTASHLTQEPHGSMPNALPGRTRMPRLTGNRHRGATPPSHVLAGAEPRHRWAVRHRCEGIRSGAIRRDRPPLRGLRPRAQNVRSSTTVSGTPVNPQRGQRAERRVSCRDNACGSRRGRTV